MTLWELFILFCKINLLSFGGPNVGILILQQELVEKKKLLSQKQLDQMFVTTNIVPGPVFIQLSVLVGWEFKKFWGTIVCLLTSITLIPFLSIILFFYLSKIIPVDKYDKFVALMSPITIVLLFNFMLKTMKQSAKKVSIWVLCLEVVISLVLLVIFKLSLFVTLGIVVPLFFIVSQVVYKIRGKDNVD